MALDAVKATLAEPEALCGTYKRYADNTALSKAREDFLMSYPIIQYINISTAQGGGGSFHR